MLGRLVELRSWEKSDIPAYAGWLRNPRVSALTHMVRRPISLRELEEEFKPYFLGEGAVHCAVVNRKNGQLVGKIHWEECLKGPGVYEVGVIVGEPELWRHGYGAEACYLGARVLFKELNAHKVMYQAAEYNRTIIDFGKDLGFKEEGRIRDRFYVDGRYVDGLWLGLLEAEFDEIARRFSYPAA